MFFLNAFTTTYMIHIELDSQYTEAWSRKGDTLEALGRHQEAQMCYNKAKELDIGMKISIFIFYKLLLAYIHTFNPQLPVHVKHFCLHQHGLSSFLLLVWRMPILTQYPLHKHMHLCTDILSHGPVNITVATSSPVIVCMISSMIRSMSSLMI